MKSKQKNNNDEYLTLDFGKLPLPWAILLSTVVLTTGIGAAIYFGLQAQTPATISDISDTGSEDYQEQEVTPLASAEFKAVTDSLADLPSKGSDDASVIMVEFGDYSCSFCGRFLKETSPTLETEYFDTGKVKMYYVDFPRTEAYQEAQKYSVCINELYGSEKFFAYHDELYQNFLTYYGASAFNTAEINKFLKSLSLDATKIETCAKASGTSEKIQGYSSLLGSLGGNTTPSFFIGKVDSNGNVTAGELFVGAQPIAAFRSLLDSYLK